MEHQLKAWKTYLAGGAIVIHQVCMFMGIDVPNETLSELIDASLAVAAIVFRLMGHLQAQTAVQVALHTPPPKPE